MIENTRRSAALAPCANEACPRPADSGEALCATCGLERSLYERDSRHAEKSDRTEMRLQPSRR